MSTEMGNAMHAIDILILNKEESRDSATQIEDANEEPPTEITEKNHAEKRLAEILSHATDITQRSPEWGIARTNTIGGSKISAFCGMGFKNVRETLEEMLIPVVVPIEKAAEDKIAMNWGTVFEDPLCEYVAKKYNCHIMGTEAFFIGRGEYEGLSYSPDGLAIIDAPRKIGEREEIVDGGVMVHDVYETNPEIVLLEYKCPYKRRLTNSMPEYYRPQIYMGMEMLGINRALFVEAVIRPCALGDMNTPGKYAKIFDTRKYTETVASGVFGIFGIKTTPEPIDMGLIDSQTFNMIVHRMAIGDWRYEPYIEGAEYSHVLGWKILGVGEHWVDAKPGFLAPLIPDVRQALRFIHEMRDQDPALIKKCIDQFQIINIVNSH